MGVDALDIKFRIEKTFQISLTVEEMRSLLRDGDLRVGDLYDYLLKKLTLRDRARYDLHLNYELWRDVQRTLQSVTGRQMDEIRMDTKLDGLFPRATRRTLWAALQDSSSQRLPEFAHPEIVELIASILALGLTSCLLAAGVGVLRQLSLWSNWFWPVLGIASICIVAEAYFKVLKVFAPLRTSLPRGMKTVKDVCRAVLAGNYAEICQQGDTAIDERCLDVWTKLQRILQDVLQLESTQITFQSRLIRDLGME